MITKTRIAGLLTALICGGLILLGVFFGLMPQLAAAEDTNGLTEDAQSLNDTYRIQLAMLEQADQDSSQLEASLAELRQALPSDADSAAWIDELRTLEKASGTFVKLFEVKDLPQPDPAAQPSDGTTPTPVAATGPQAIPVSLQVAGEDYKAVAKFVDEVQNGSRLFTVRHALIQQDDVDGGKAWSATLDGFLYVLPEIK